MRRLLGSLIVLAAATTTARASSPVVRGMTPLGGQRGTAVEVAVNGQRLSDAKEILFYQPGIRVTKFEPVSESQVKATFQIDPDARLGLYDFRLRSATGISRLRTFSVGAMKDVAEVEPNNEFTKPQLIGMNVTVNGVAENEDVDYYAFQARKGERITAEVEGIRLGEFLFDPFVAILDAKRFELKSSDDAALIWQDGFASVVAPEDGTYFVLVRESAYAGNANCLYRLHVGNFPRPTATVPAGGKFGEDVSVRWIGDPLGETSSTIKLPAGPQRNYGLIAQDGRGPAPYPNAFRLSPFDNVIEAEPNDDRATATPCVPPVALNGVIGKAGDVDYFGFKASKGQTYDVKVFARQLRSPLDPVLALGLKTGGVIQNNDDSGGPDSGFRFTAPNDGEYAVWLSDHLKKGGLDYFYRVEISAVAPKLVLSTPNESIRRGTGTMALAVPQGNRQAILINASRIDFGGDVTLSAADLPPGVSFETDVMPAGTATVPVLFTATAEAPPGATLATVSGKPVDAKVKVTSEFASTTELVLGQNNVPFWTRTVDTLAVAVTDPAPFTIEIVPPRVPIVRGGTMDLKVVARRKPGFTAPIAVMLPWNPPGLASKQDVTIPENQNEASIPLNANNGAELRTWNVVANGTYTEPPTGTPPPRAGNRRGFGSGRLTVSSGFTKLTVAPPFVTLKFEAVSVEQGKETDLPVKVLKAVDFPGEATVTLVGLPNKVTAAPLTITRETGDVVFRVKTDPTSPAGETKNLFCQVVVTQDGEPIVHNLGTGRLRIDAPLARKASAATAQAKPQTAGTAAARPLSRLERLRQESRERANTAAGASK